MVRNGPVAPRAKRSWWHRLRPGGGNRRTVATVGRAVPTAAAPPAAPPRPRRPRDLRAVGRALAAVATLGVMAGSVIGLRHVLTHSPHFAVREVRVSPTRHVSADALRARAGVTPGRNLFTIDLPYVTRELQSEPWVARATVRRELPGVVAIDVVEHEPACVVSLGALYLADAAGVVFKRATLDEAAALPVVTGIPRDGYVDDRDASQALLREALATLALWRAGDRPAVGEVHIDPTLGATLYLAHGGAGVRLGRGEPALLATRLARFDLAWRALADEGQQDDARLVLLDQRARPDRVTVKLAAR